MPRKPAADASFSLCSRPWTQARPRLMEAIAGWKGMVVVGEYCCAADRHVSQEILRIVDEREVQFCSEFLEGWMDGQLVHRHFLHASGSPVKCFAGVVEARSGLSVSFTLRAYLRPIFTSDEFQQDPASGTPSLQNMPSSNAPPPPTQERPDSRTPNP